MGVEKKIILLVDRDVNIHSLFDSENLFEDKINVIHFYSSNEALNYLRRNKVDLIISDINFTDPHDIDGLHLLRQSKEFYPKLPCIIFSALDYRHYGWLTEVYDAYIIKSSDFSELVKHIENLLNVTPVKWGTRQYVIYRNRNKFL